jgi:outer membrane protein assembly factor BamB
VVVVTEVAAGPASLLFGEGGLSTVKSIEQLVFVGLNGYAVALDRDTGEIVWSNNELKSGYVTLLLDGDRLIVSTNGYIFCLNPLTGRILWNNRMSGYGSGTPTSLISVRGQGSPTLIQQAAEETKASEQASAAHNSDG